MNIGDRIQLMITDITDNGEGIGRVDGLAVFVQGALPGDQVIACVSEDKGRFAIARLETMVRPSDARVTSDCAHSESCGGCGLRELSYEAQLSLKQSMVTQALRRIGKLSEPNVNAIIGMEDSKAAYRNKAEFSIKNGKLGYYEQGSKRLVSIESCKLQSEPAMAAALAFGDFLRRHPKNIYKNLVVRTGATGQVMVIIVANKDEVSRLEELVVTLDDAIQEPWSLESIVLNINKNADGPVLGSTFKVLAGKSVIDDEIVTDAGCLKLEVSPLAFYQVNTVQAGRLYSKVQEYAALTGTETVLDLYCGAGAIGLTMAQKASRVIGVESLRPAVIDANRNAVINRIVNAEFICGKAEDIVDKRLSGINADIIVLDPPRAGCHPNLLKTVSTIGPEKLIYVSCNPATLARDVKLLSGYGYQLLEATPVDMFPHTRHVETVALLSGKSPNAHI